MEKALHFLHFRHLKMVAQHEKIEAPLRKIAALRKKIVPLNFAKVPPLR